MTHFLNRANDFLTDYFQPRGMKFLSLVGFFYLTYKSFSAIHSFARTFLPVQRNLAHRYGPGSWVVITGGAMGIGACFGHELAAKGFNVVLIDFNKEKLEETASHLRAKHSNIQVKTILCDFADSWKEGFFDSVMDQLQGLDISILVNNVGTGYAPGIFHKASPDYITKTITVNILPMTLLTRRIIPLMLNRPTRSAIINLASLAGIYPIPTISIYSASKAYTNHFSRAIEHEVAHKIDVMTVRPGMVSTALTGHPPVSGAAILPDKVAKSALRKLGSTSETQGDWRHEIIGWMFRQPFIRSLLLRDAVENARKKGQEP